MAYRVYIPADPGNPDGGVYLLHSISETAPDPATLPADARVELDRVDGTGSDTIEVTP